MSCELAAAREAAPEKLDSLRIALRHYYWKPGKALFHAFELEAYARAGIRLEPPVMDLGCSDGTFVVMLQERRILSSVDLALDYEARGLPRAKSGSRHGAVQADARALPIRSGAFASVLANGVICSVTADFEQAIAEAARVLSERGTLVLSVPTPRVAEGHLFPALLRKLGASRLASRHLARLNQRLALHHMLDEQIWRRKLEAAHFHVERIGYYFTPWQAFWSNLLTMQAFRVFAPLKALRERGPGRWVAWVMERAFRSLFERERAFTQERRRDQAGWLLIVARKMPTQTESEG